MSAEYLFQQTAIAIQIHNTVAVNGISDYLSADSNYSKQSDYFSACYVKTNKINVA